MEQNNNPVQNEGERTFTQDDVNRIVGERLSKEKDRAAAELAKREQDLHARELRITAREKLAEKGLPVELLEALNCTSEEALDKSVNLISEHLKKTAPPIFTGKVPYSPDVKESGDRGIRRAMGLR